MKYTIDLLIVLLLLSSCSRNTSQVSDGPITNPSAEENIAEKITGWTAEAWSKGIIPTYDYNSHSGERSLLLYADRPAAGRWMTKVNLRPWSRYLFTGWIKTEGLAVIEGNGAGFRFDAFSIDYPGLTGTNDWTEVKFEFETGNDNSSVLSCMLNVDGPASGRAWFDDMSLELLSSEKITPAVRIDLAQTEEPMSEYIYGQFIEHLGRCIYGGIWAEMLEDRKFWYVPGEKESPWETDGHKDLFSVDRVDPFAGDKTPVLGAGQSGSALIRQSGLGMKPDLDYTGRIILKATPGIQSVNVTLKWGENQRQSQSAICQKAMPHILWNITQEF